MRAMVQAALKARSERGRGSVLVAHPIRDLMPVQFDDEVLDKADTLFENLNRLEEHLKQKLKTRDERSREA